MHCLQWVFLFGILLAGCGAKEEEKAKDYWSGYKSAEEVSRVVNNRAQLYLDERK